MTRALKNNLATAYSEGGRLDPDNIDPGIQADLAGSYFRLLSPILSAASDKSMTDHPIGPGLGKISTLQAVVHNPGISQMELSEMFGRDRSIQFRIVVDLEKRGMIRREVDPQDTRRHALYATDLGASLMPELDQLVRVNDRIAFATLSEPEYETLKALMRRVFLSHIGVGASYWGKS